jgi:hypothetical protein
MNEIDAEMSQILPDRAKISRIKKSIEKEDGAYAVRVSDCVVFFFGNDFFFW